MIFPHPYSVHGSACRLCAEYGADFLVQSDTGYVPACANCLENMHYNLHRNQYRRGIGWNSHEPENEPNQTLQQLHESLHEFGFLRKYP